MADERKAQLIARLARARAEASANTDAVREDLQIGEKLKENIGNNRGAWLSGAVLAGLVISKIPPRTKKVVVTSGKAGKVEKEIEAAGKAGLFLGALRMIFNLVQPFLVKWITRRLQGGPAGPAYPRSVRR
jgi:hypothetical protein